MKHFILITSLCMMILIISGCGTTAKATVVDTPVSGITPQTNESTDQDMPKTMTIDYKNKAFGMAMPDWVPDVLDDNYDSFKEKFKCQDETVFKVEGKGANLELVQSWLQNAQFNTQVAQSLTTLVEQRFSAVLSNKEKTQKAVIASVSKAKFAGFQKRADFWALQRTIDKAKNKVIDEYNVIQLYSIDRELYEKLLKSYIDTIIEDFDLKDQQKAEGMADELAKELATKDLSTEIER